MIQYITEIKNRSILMFITWLSIFIVSYFYKETLLFLFLKSEIFANNEYRVNYFIFTDIMEIFEVYLQLIFFITFQIFFLYFLYHSFIFFSFGLFFREYCYLINILKISISTWFLSILFSKYFLIPMMWKFFLQFQNANFINIYFEAKLIDYLNFYTKFYYIFICYCQILTLLYIFFKYINENTILIKKFRKLYYYFFVVVSTLISPPDIFSQLSISFILIFCYEYFIYVYILKLLVNKLIRQPVKTNKNSSSK